MNRSSISRDSIRRAGPSNAGPSGPSGPTGPVGPECCGNVLTIAALSLLDTSVFENGASVWVNTKKAPYRLDKFSTGTADGNFLVATLSGTGRWVRQFIPVPEWQALAVNGTGLFINFQTGNDEGNGTSAEPLLSVREFCARLWGGVFTTVSPRVNIVGTGSAVAADGIFWGFRCLSQTPLLVIGVETVLTAGVAITAATAQASASSQGFLTSTTTDFQTGGLLSTTARTLWARRANTSGGQTTFASLYRTHNSGGNFSVDISIQRQLNPTTMADSATSQPFAAGDVVDLVTLPVLPGMDSSVDLAVKFVKIDIASGGRILGLIFNCSIMGSRGTFIILSGSAGLQTTQFTGGTLVNAYASTVLLTSTVLGCQGSVLTVSNSGFLQLNGWTQDNSSINAVSGGIVSIGSNGWIQQTATPFTATQGGQILPTTTAALLWTIGVGVTNGCTVRQGGRLIGAANFSTALNAFGSGTPWSVGGTAYATAALGVLDNNDLSAIVN